MQFHQAWSNTSPELIKIASWSVLLSQTQFQNQMSIIFIQWRPVSQKESFGLEVTI